MSKNPTAPGVLVLVGNAMAISQRPYLVSLGTFYVASRSFSLVPKRSVALLNSFATALLHCSSAIFPTNFGNEMSYRLAFRIQPYGMALLLLALCTKATKQPHS
jgi:hypothetical protein